MFSYGSGLASSMFFLKFQRDYSQIKDVLNLTERITKKRTKISIEEYDAIMATREQQFGFLPSSPTVNHSFSVENNSLLSLPKKVNFNRLSEGVFYLSSVDNMWRRQYQRLNQPHPTPSSQSIKKNDCSNSNKTSDRTENNILIIDDVSFNE